MQQLTANESGNLSPYRASYQGTLDENQRVGILPPMAMITGCPYVGGCVNILYGNPNVQNTFQVIGVDSAGNQSIPATITNP